MKTKFPLLILAGLFGTATAQAADITWGSATSVNDVNDISTTGFLVEAINLDNNSQPSQIVNGVTFTTEKVFGNIGSGLFDQNTGNTNYNTILDTVNFGFGAGSTLSVGDSNLISGRDYEMQIWYSDTRGSTKQMGFADGNGNTVDLTTSSTSGAEFAIGTFTAGGTNQDLQLITGAGNGNAHFNAYQIRGLAATQTWDGSGDTTWSAGSDGTSWSGAANTFIDGDAVQFDSTVAGTVNITGAVSPGSVSVSGANDYTFSGTGAIGGAGTLTKSGTGTLTLSGANTYTGGTTLNSGKLTIANNNALGTGTLTLAGTDGTLSTLSSAAGAGYNLSEAIVVNGTTAVFTESNTGGTNFELTGDISGTGTLNFGGTGDGQGNRAVQVRDNLDGFTGTINFDNVSGKNTVLFYGVNTTAALELSGNTSSGYLGLQSANATFGELSGTGGRIQGWSRTLTINQDTDTTYAGTMVDTNSSNKLSFTKAGSGSLTLTVANTYTGATTVNNGTLIIDGDQSGATGAMTINGSGTLAGSGMIGASLLTVNGVIAPGNSPGTLATNSQLWNDGGAYLWEIDDTTGTRGTDAGWDWLDITGTLDLTGLTADGFTIDIDSLLHVDHTSGDALNFDLETDYSFVIASATIGISGFDASLFNLDASGFTNEGWLWSISADANNIYLGAAAVPEPATYALLGGLLALGHVMVRRRR